MAKMNCNNCGKECEFTYCSRECWAKVEAPIWIDRAGLNLGEYKKMEINNFKANVSITSRISLYIDTLADASADDLKGLYIYGSVGTGKTHLMVSIGKEIVRRRCSMIKFIHMPEWMGKFYGSIKYRDRIMQKAKDAIVLLVDDLGAEQQTDYTIPIMCELLDYRWTRKLLTYFTSNLTPDQVDKNVDPRIISRISGLSKFIMLTGKDGRVKK